MVASKMLWVALSSDQAPKPSNHRKTSLSVKSLSLILPTPFYLNLPPHRAELPELKTTVTPLVIGYKESGIETDIL
jgi:hypothetical protein